MYINLNNIAYDHISQEDNQWLDQYYGDELFVAITDGDCSLVRDFEKNPLTLAEIASEGESISMGDIEPSFIPEGYSLIKCKYCGFELVPPDE